MPAKKSNTTKKPGGASRSKAMKGGSMAPLNILLKQLMTAMAPSKPRK